MKINLGSGTVKGSIFAKDWVNVDFSYNPNADEWKDAEYMRFDITKPWPLEENSVDCIYASHIFEHILYDKVLSVSKECLRVLKLGHPMRIICPDPRIFVRNWRMKNLHFIATCFGKEYFERFNYKENTTAAFTDMFFHERYDHYLCPSIDYIQICMIKAGFKVVEELNCGNTLYPEFFGCNGDRANIDSFDNRPVMSYYLECAK